MKILVLLNGTVVVLNNTDSMPAGINLSWRGAEALDFLHDLTAYKPAGRAGEKLQAWKNQGADILYLSSRDNFKSVEIDKFLLKLWDFPEGPVFFRHRGETFQDIVEKIVPEILIENDCFSMGGEKAMISHCLPLNLKQMIKTIVVKENQGIDHLPDNLSALKKY
jgi:hypothetical protein